MYKGTILYVGNFELPDKSAAAHRVMNNGKIFKQLGYRVVYLGTLRNDKHFEGIRKADFCNDVYEEAYPLSSKQWVRHMFDTKNICEVVSKCESVKMIILYNVPFVTLLAVRKAFKNKGIKIVYDCTEWNNYTEGSFIKRFIKKLDEFEIRHLIGRFTDALIVISKMMKNKYVKSNNRILLLPPLVDVNDDIWHQERIDHGDCFEFCFAGSVGNKENLESIVKAFGVLNEKNVYLRVIGVERADFITAFPELESTLSKNKSNIIFMGRLSHEQTIKHILSSDCYIFIRESDRRNNAGFPTKFAEAYTCGLPIITTDVSDVKSYLSGTEKDLLVRDTAVGSVLKAMRIAIDRNSGATKSNRELNKAFDYHNNIKKADKWLSSID